MRAAPTPTTANANAVLKYLLAHPFIGVPQLFVFVFTPRCGMCWHCGTISKQISAVWQGVMHVQRGWHTHCTQYCQTKLTCKATFVLGAVSNQLFAPTTAVATHAPSLPRNRVLRRLCVVRLHDWPIRKLVFLGPLRRPLRTAAGNIHRAGFHGCPLHRVRLVDHLLVGPRLPVRYSPV